MIIDYSQTRVGLEISYVNENNQISVDEVILENGFYNYVECEDSDPNKLELRSFKGSAMKAEPSKYFTHHNINEFLNHDIPNNYPVFYNKFSRLGEPNPFSCDIEVPPTQEFGYSPPDKAQNPIVSISFTDKNLSSILFILKNKNYPKINDFDLSYINNILKDSLGELWDKHEFPIAVRIFDTETEMLKVFLECMLNHFHLIIGWNFLGYDWQYIYNRCINLGINVKKASPTGKLSRKKIDINDHTSIDLQIPTHRIISDYMILFQDSLIYNNLGSYSLDSCSEMILHMHKVSYEGNLRTLYENDFLRFISYAFIDTILVMLLHKATNLLTVDFFQSYYTGVPYLKLSQNSISEALIYQELRSDNLFLLESEKNKNPQRKYKGGYVKSPTKKIVEAVMGIDFGALYPNCIIVGGLSPETRIDKILCNAEGYPLNEFELAKWYKYKDLGYTLTPMGNIYDGTNGDALYVRIEKKLLLQRSIFKGHMNNIYLEIIPKLEAEINRRKELNQIN